MQAPHLFPPWFWDKLFPNQKQNNVGILVASSSSSPAVSGHAWAHTPFTGRINGGWSHAPEQASGFIYRSHGSSVEQYVKFMFKFLAAGICLLLMTKKFHSWEERKVAEQGTSEFRSNHPHWVALDSSSRRPNTLFWPPWTHAHAHAHTQTHRWYIYIYIKLLWEKSIDLKKKSERSCYLT